MTLHNLVPVLLAWMMCHGKHKVMPTDKPPANSLPEPLAHMLDDLQDSKTGR